MSPRLYHSKLLLFGEHTVLRGSQALAIPFPVFSGRWVYASPKDNLSALQQNLKTFAQYLKSIRESETSPVDVNAKAFERALQEGLYFQSNIPSGYGVGSSGALCAAVWDNFGHAETVRTLSELRQTLAQLESYFHGSSSGTDPLISYLDHPVLIAPESGISEVAIPEDKPEGKGALFLLDTKISRSTQPLVNHFLTCCEEESYRQRIEAELVPLVNDAIAAFLQARWSLLLEAMHQISHFQLRYFEKMIPATFKNLWLDGLTSSTFKLKLCGAGGGGFLLGSTPNWELLQKELADYELLKVLSF